MLKVALQVDDPAGWNAAGDTTLMIALEAQKRGHALFYYLAPELTYSDGVLVAPLRAVRFHDDVSHWFDAQAPTNADLSTMDVVLVRQDPPFDMGYITATYMLERLPDSVKVLNAPHALRDCPEKMWMLRYPEFLPPTMITRDLDAVQSFAQTHKDIILKPLHGYGGRSVFKCAAGDGNIAALVEQWNALAPEPFMVQQFLPEVASEDKRIILINGKVVGATGRIPAAGEIRANFRVGGTAAAVELNAKQQHICDTIGPALRDAGIHFAGVDLIGDYLTEVNVTSPTGFRAIKDLYGVNPAEAFWDSI